MVLFKIWFLCVGVNLEFHSKCLLFAGWKKTPDNEYAVAGGLLGLVILFRIWAFWEKADPPALPPVGGSPAHV